MTGWVMTALLSYKLQSQFQKSNGMLPGQIFVRRERELYVKLCYVVLKSKTGPHPFVVSQLEISN